MQTIKMAYYEQRGPLEIDLSEIPKLVYEKVLLHCKASPEKRDQSREIFLASLDRYIDVLIETSQYEEVFRCFYDSQQLYPDDADVLNTLGVALNRLKKPLEALDYLIRAHKICPSNLKILQNIENATNEWIPRWHYAMLNDKQRNFQYRKAIEKEIHNREHKTVLDIGTGTGLLALYALSSGAEKVFACETNEVMLNVAENVFKKNKADIKLISKHSTEIMPSDLGVDGVDLIVTEIFDCGAFGEGILSTLIHAKEKLLLQKGRIIPNDIEIHVIGVNQIEVAETCERLENTFENSIYLKRKLIKLKSDGPYEPINLINTKMQMVTKSAHAFTVDFNDLQSLKSAEAGEKDTRVALSCNDDTTLEGFLVYFYLHLDDEHHLCNFDPENLDNMHNEIASCWEPIIFQLNKAMPVRKYQILHANVSCKSGILNISHNYNLIELNTDHITVETDVFEFLTDDEYIYELEYNVESFIKKRKLKSLHCLADFMPFPHIGINLLKENIVDKLYCLETVKDIVKAVASWNCIPEQSIIFINDLDELLAANEVKFDLILIQPITHFGTLNEELLKYYEQLKSKALSTTGFIFPHKIDLCCKLIYSSWLDRVTAIRQDDENGNQLKKLHITEFMNRYSTRHQYEFIDFDSSDLSEVFTLTTIPLNEKLHQKDIVINLNSSGNRINAILYYYKIYFMSNSQPILTNRKNSFCKLNCFVQSVNIESKTTAVVNFTQNDFVFRCNIKE